MDDFNLRKYLKHNPLLSEEGYSYTTSSSSPKYTTTTTSKNKNVYKKGKKATKPKQTKAQKEAAKKKEAEKYEKEMKAAEKKAAEEFEKEHGIKPGRAKGSGRKGINTLDDYKLWEDGEEEDDDIIYDDFGTPIPKYILDAVHEFALEFGLGDVEYQEPIGNSIGGRAVINWDTGREGEIIGSEEEEIGTSDHNEKMEYINNNPILKNSWSKLDSMGGEAAFWVTYPLTEYDTEEKAEMDMENRVGDEMTENLFGHPGRTGYSLGRTPGHLQTPKEKWDAMHEDERMTFLHSHIKDPDEADSYLDSHIDELPNQVTAAL